MILELDMVVKFANIYKQYIVFNRVAVRLQ